ncbi:MAG: signal peptidase I [Mariprofundaceae bacterium]|nr:signal peptidase I [Mariprofundaceae bacterium]
MFFNRSIMQWAALLTIIIAIILFLRISIINVASIASGSMLPNYDVHDRIISNQLRWGLNLPLIQQQVIQWHAPQRGDVVLFHNPHDHGKIWMKRVIGLPGDHIEFRKRQLYVNHQRCTLPKHHKEHLPQKNNTFSTPYKLWTSYLERDWGPITVPEGALFLLGDNRGNSLDSRVWGTIPITYLTGQPFARIWPISDIAWMP